MEITGVGVLLGGRGGLNRWLTDSSGKDGGGLRPRVYGWVGLGR